MPEKNKTENVIREKVNQLKLFIVLFLFVASAVISSSAQASVKSFHIAVLFSKNSAVYQEVYTGFSEYLDSVISSQPDQASVKKPAIIVDKYFADDVESFDKFVINKKSYDLLLTIGTQAALTAAGSKHELPLLNIFLPRSSFEDIRRMYGRYAHVSTIFIDQPFARQFSLIKLLLPDVTSVGLFIGKGISPLLDELRVAANISGIKLVEKYIDDIITAHDIKELARKSDAILALPDYKLLSPHQAKWLIYISYQHNKAVFGFSRSIVNAGALAAVYSPPQYIGRQAAEWVATRLVAKASSALDNGLNMPVYYNVSINKTVADSLSVRQSNINKLKSEYGALAVVMQ